MSQESRYDKVYGALLGRCAGCLLGKPVEGWRKAQIDALLKATGNYPVHDYMRSDVAPDIVAATRLKDAPLAAWVNNLHGHAPVDDDTNYTVLGYKILSVHGMGFTPDDVAGQWLGSMPLLAACTAERVAYINLASRVYPPDSAVYRNPYREWIGAQIRADYYGYATPGRPALGAELAWRDASISHVKNGIYGAMFVAAMISAAGSCSDVLDVVRQGLAQIPFHSRLAEAVRDVLTWPERLADWEQAVVELHKRYDEKDPHDWCHTIPNALVVCIGLLYGGLDFGKSIGIAVMSGFDTDCNGATVGSIVGMIVGARALPEKWTSPLNDTLETSITGYPMVRLSEIAKDTVRLYWTGGRA
jgi:ADP-ribosylglycohydrolase